MAMSPTITGLPACNCAQVSTLRGFIGFALLAASIALQTGTVQADSIVVFNEIMYHPATNEPAMEWVELHNQNAVDVDLGGWRISDAVDYVFPHGTVIKGGGLSRGRGRSGRAHGSDRIDECPRAFRGEAF